MGLHLVDGLQLREEPFIDISHLPDLLHCVPLVECGSEGEEALVRGVYEFFINILDEIVLIRT